MLVTDGVAAGSHTSGESDTFAQMSHVHVSCTQSDKWILECARAQGLATRKVVGTDEVDDICDYINDDKDHEIATLVSNHQHADTRNEV